MRNRPSSARRLLCLMTGVFLAGSAAAAPPDAPSKNHRRPPVSQPAPPEAPAEEDILGPREKVAIPVPEEFPWGLWLGVGGGVLAAGLLFWWWSRWKGRRIEVAPAERALTALAVIDSSRNAMESGALADRSADVVRKFISERFGIAAPQRTTEEFLHELAVSTSTPLSIHSPHLRVFLRSCDMAKFAGAGFDASERLTLLETAIRFVRSSNSPAPAPPPPVPSEAV